MKTKVGFFLYRFNMNLNEIGVLQSWWLQVYAESVATASCCCCY